MFIAVLPILVLRDVAISPQTYGFVVSIGGLAGVVGSLTGLWIRSRLGSIRTMLLADCMLPLAFAAPAVAAALPAAAAVIIGVAESLFGLAIVVHGISSTGIRAQVTPHHLMGRVTAASRFVTMGAVPVGSVIGGALGTWWGHPAVVLVAAALAAGAPLILWNSPVGRLREVPTRWEAPEEVESPLRR